jgi:hypothetical protein
LTASSWKLVFLAACLFLTGFTVYDQVFHQTGLAFLWDEQLRFHRWVIEGTAADPWQYRILAPYLIEGGVRLATQLGYEGPHVFVFVVTRLLQNTLMFMAAIGYWRRLGIPRGLVLIGLAVFAWGITYAGYGSHLAFDTYFDVLFYLLAGYAILAHRPIWIIPLTAIAALNRETSALIPALLASTALSQGRPFSIDRRTLTVAAVAGAVFVAAFVAVRLALGPRDPLVAYGHRPGLDMLLFNLTNRQTYFSLVATLSYIPLLALLLYREWPTVLRRFFWALVPLWIIVHAFMAVAAEARLFLVPQALIFIPACLLTADEIRRHNAGGLPGRAAG